MMNLVFFLLAVVLGCILFPIGMIYTLVKYSIWGKGSLLLRIAVAIDQIGNTILEDLFNDLLITKEGYRFGDVRETVSSAMGKNKVRGTLTRTGRALDAVLEFFDDNHSIKSIKKLKK
jgi:hypothetical protein